MIMTSLILGATLFSSLTQASVRIITGTIEGESKTLTLSLNLDSNNDITGMTVESHDPNAPYEAKSYNDSEIYGGIVLYRQSGRDIVTLSSDNFAAHQGGAVQLTYLYNGITGRRYSLMIDLYRDGDTWKVSKDGQDFSRVHFYKKRQRFVGVVGVRSIDFNR